MSRAVKGSLSRSHDIPWHTPACPVQRCQASSFGVTWLCSHGPLPVAGRRSPFCHRGDLRDSASRCWYAVASDAREDQWHAKFERKHGWGPHRRACKVENPVCKSVCAPHRVFHVSACPQCDSENLTSIQPFNHVFCAPGHPTTDDLANNPPCSSRLASTDDSTPSLRDRIPQYRLGVRAARPGPSPTFRLSGVGAGNICWTRRTFHLVLSITYVLASALQRTHSTTRLGFTPAL